MQLGSLEKHTQLISSPAGWVRVKSVGLPILGSWPSIILVQMIRVLIPVHCACSTGYNLLCVGADSISTSSLLQGLKLCFFSRKPNCIFKCYLKVLCIETSTSLGSLQKFEGVAWEFKGALGSQGPLILSRAYCHPLYSGTLCEPFCHFNWRFSLLCKVVGKVITRI